MGLPDDDATPVKRPSGMGHMISKDGSESTNEGHAPTPSSAVNQRASHGDQYPVALPAIRQASKQAPRTFDF